MTNHTWYDKQTVVSDVKILSKNSVIELKNLSQVHALPQYVPELILWRIEASITNDFS